MPSKVERPSLHAVVSSQARPRRDPMIRDLQPSCGRHRIPGPAGASNPGTSPFVLVGE